MHSSRLHDSRRRCLAVLALAALVTCPALARADLAGPPLRQLLGAATAVGFGDVAAVATAGDGKTQVATVVLADLLAGSAPATVTLAWSPDDPEGVPVGVGGRLLLMLRPATPGGPATYQAVSPAGGLAFLTPATEMPARMLIEAALANGGDVPLATVLQLGAGGGPHPPVTLLAAALADLAGRVGAADGPAIGPVACAEPGSVQRDVRLWALEHVGRTASQDGLACARALAKRAIPTKSNPAGLDVPTAIAAFRGLAADPTPATVGVLNSAVKVAIKTSPFATEKCAGEIPALLATATLSLAVTRDVRSASTLYKVAVKRPVRSAASTAVYGLRLIGDARAVRYLERLAERHPDARIRQQALESLPGVAA